MRLLSVLLALCSLLVPAYASAQGKAVPRVGILTVAGGLSVESFIRGLLGVRLHEDRR